MAATIQEALDDIVDDLGTTAGNVVARMDTWMNEMFTVAGFAAAFWNGQSADQRTVYNWFVPNERARREINLIGNGNLLAVNIAINVVFRTLLAVQAAQAQGRITAAQQAAVVTAYTNAWE